MTKKELWDFQFKNTIVNCQWEPEICCICNKKHDKKKMKSFNRLNSNWEKEYKYICRNCFTGE